MVLAVAALAFWTSAAACNEPVVELLWPDGTPNAPAKITDDEVVDRAQAIRDRHVSNVHRPSVTVYRAPTDKSTGAAVVICPGGGYGILAIDKEGHDVARWFNTFGVTGIVLKYRLPRPKGHVYGHMAPLADAQRAMRLTRARAAAWHIDPKRVGIMGFSAGGHVASTVATHFDLGKPDAADSIDQQSCRPDFQILVYPVVSFSNALVHVGSRNNLLGTSPDPAVVAFFANEKHVSPQTPPTFLMHTDDDPVSAENSVSFYLSLRAAKVPGELHVYAKGGHGYGIRTDWQGIKDPPVSTWPERCRSWLGAIGMLKATSGSESVPTN